MELYMHGFEGEVQLLEFFRVLPRDAADVALRAEGEVQVLALPADPVALPLHAEALLGLGHHGLDVHELPPELAALVAGPRLLLQVRFEVLLIEFEELLV